MQPVDQRVTLGDVVEHFDPRCPLKCKKGLLRPGIEIDPARTMDLRGVVSTTKVPSACMCAIAGFLKKHMSDIDFINNEQVWLVGRNPRAKRRAHEVK